MKWLVRKTKKLCTPLHYIEYLFILASIVTGCVSISAFASLVVSALFVSSSAVELKNCALIASINKYKAMTNEKSVKYNETVMLGKNKLNNIEVLIFRALSDSFISHDELVSVNLVKRLLWYDRSNQK